MKYWNLTRQSSREDDFKWVVLYTNAVRVRTYISTVAHAPNIKYSTRITSPWTESYILLRLIRDGSAVQT